MRITRSFGTHYKAPKWPDSARHIEMVPLSKLRPARRNAHQHPKKQIGQLAESIKRFGFINPVIIDDQGNIVAGHGRIEAAKLLRMRNVPVIRLSDLSEAERVHACRQ
jgi:ParB-like chromosome segregation protein Spo0J